VEITALRCSLTYSQVARLLALIAIAGSVYFVGLGRAGFDDAEAYSAFIASRATIAEVYETSLQLDPGKGGGLYVALLHFYCEFFGTGEIAMRAFSAAFALAGVILLYALASELFEADTALIATALWAFNPIALIVARWARMYSMFIALAIASLLALVRLQRRPTMPRAAAFGILGAAMLYIHLGGALMLGAEAAILIRERWRGRPMFAGNAGLALTLILFLPIAPSAFAEVHSSALGHRFDWMGSASHMPLAVQIVGASIAIALGFLIVFGPPLRFDKAAEPLRWCLIWTLLPALALLSGSLLLHPMFEIRYIAPVVAGFAMLAAAGLKFASARVRNLATTAVAAAFLIVAIVFHLYSRPFDLWQNIARAVEASDTPSQDVFFEAGYVMGIRQAQGADPESLIEVLPRGYLRIPFDYYFRGTSPRRAINPFRTASARETLAQSARRNRGAWLVSHMNADDLAAELPPGDEFRCDRIIYDPSVSISLYHIVPRDADH